MHSELRVSTLALFITNSLFINTDQRRINPAEQIIIEGQDARFTCLASSAVLWQFNKSSILHSNAFYDGNALFIQNVRLPNQGFYECHGTTEYGEVFVARSLLVVRGMICYCGT